MSGCLFNLGIDRGVNYKVIAGSDSFSASLLDVKFGDDRSGKSIDLSWLDEED